MACKPESLPKCTVCGKRLSKTKYKLCKKHTPRKGVKGRVGFWTGKKHTEEYKLKMKDSLLKRKFKHTKEHIESISGENNWNWKGGATPKSKLIRVSAKYKEWRTSVFERDDYTCQKCGQIGGKLNAHHKKQFSIYPDLRFDINNGVTLCEPCHKKEYKHIPTANSIDVSAIANEDDRRVLYSFPEAKKLETKEDCILGKHYHKIKTEYFILIQGKSKMIKELNGKSVKVAMKIGKVYKIVPGTYHEFHIEKDSVLIGINSHPYDPTDDYKL